jgi:uncharacterized lipoprotein YajG
MSPSLPARWSRLAAAAAALGIAALLGMLAGCHTPPTAPPAAEAPAHAALVRMELASIVAEEPAACGAVLEFTRLGRLDYRVRCASGRSLRVRVSGDGRVLVLPDEPVPPR